jgi:signal transduction histidine kinase
MQPVDSHPPPERDRNLTVLDELRQTERRAVGGLVASVLGHVIGTPLHVIAGRASLIRANPTPESAIENAQRIEEQVERLARRIRGLIDYLTVPDPAVEPWTLAQVIDETLAISRPVALARGIELSVTTLPLPEGRVDGNNALLVLTSLVSLALRSASAGSTVALAVSLPTPGSIHFELDVPGMQPPRVRIDRLEPPDDWDRREADQLQVLSLCFAIASRGGGHVALEKTESSALMRFRCAAAGG